MDESVYDMSLQSESNPNIFIKKDWISILDNQNGVYSGNQCVIDTSQLSNSNKWMNYREAYLQVPLLLTLGSTADGVEFLPLSGTSNAFFDSSLSLKNWYGSVIHSVSLDINGSTIIQQTPFQSLWNTFKLMTTLSFQDVIGIGGTIGFYPDNSTSFDFNAAVQPGGLGTCNNINLFAGQVVSGVALMANDTFNRGILERQRKWNFNVSGVCGNGTYAALTNTTNLTNIYRSCVEDQELIIKKKKFFLFLCG